jgi:hypothetical protein
MKRACRIVTLKRPEKKKSTERVEERGVNGMKGVWIVRCTDRCNNQRFEIRHLGGSLTMASGSFAPGRPGRARDLRFFSAFVLGGKRRACTCTCTLPLGTQFGGRYEGPSRTRNGHASLTGSR